MRKGKHFMLLLCTLLFITLTFSLFAEVEAAGKIWKPLPLRTQAQFNEGMPGGEGMQMIFGISYSHDPNIAYFVSDTSGVWRGEWKEAGSMPEHPDFEGFFWESKRGYYYTGEPQDPADDEHMGFRPNGGISLSVDPLNANIVFVSGARHNSSSEYDSAVNGIYRTLDGGTSWEQVFETKYHRNREGQHFAFDPACQGERCMTVYAGTHESGLLKSESGGDPGSWTVLGLSGKRIYDIEINREGTNTILYVATDDISESGKGLYKVIVDGAGSAIVSPLGNLPDFPRTIALAPQSNPDSDIIYAAVGTNQVYKSDDGGQLFKKQSSGLPANKDYKIVDISNANSEYLYVYYHGSGGKQPYYSHDGGLTWWPPVDIDSGNLLFYASAWYGSTTATHPTNPNIALRFFNPQCRVAMTLDGGYSWAYAGNGYMGGRRGGNRTSAYFDPDDPDRKIFFLTDYGPFLTTDNGETWNMLLRNSDYSKTTPVGTVDPDYPDRFITAKGGWSLQYIAVSVNSGVSWTVFNGGDENSNDYYDNQGNLYTSPELRGEFKFLQYDPNDNNYIYAGAKNGSWISSDKGQTWTYLNDKSIRALHPGDGSGNSIIYSFGSCTSGSPTGCNPAYWQSVLFQSEDRGETWDPVNYISIGRTGLIDVEVDPENMNRLYVAGSIGFYLYDKCDANDTDCSTDGKWGKSVDGIEEEAFGGQNDSQLQVQSVVVDPNYPNIIYAGMRSTYGHRHNFIYRSTDKGITWQDIKYNLEGYSTAWSLAIDPLNSVLHLSSDNGNYVLCNDEDGDGIAEEGGLCGNVDTCQSDLPVKMSGEYYSTINDAYGAAINNNVIRSHEEEIVENLILDMDKSITLDGGYDCSHVSKTGVTVINGNITISDGSVTIMDFVIE